MNFTCHGVLVAVNDSTLDTAILETKPWLVGLKMRLPPGRIQETHRRKGCTFSSFAKWRWRASLADSMTIWVWRLWNTTVKIWVKLSKQTLRWLLSLPDQSSLQTLLSTSWMKAAAAMQNNPAYLRMVESDLGQLWSLDGSLVETSRPANAKNRIPCL